ncbi:MAG TPA: DMT family transporter [Gaiellaceae bacterium]|nr:DMT family transporter [Gaiellaceae bacterium]
MSGSAITAAMAVVAGLAGAVQVAVMAGLGDRIGSVGALAFATVVSAVLAVVALLVAEGSFDAFSRAVHQPWWTLTGGLVGLFILLTITVAGSRIGIVATVGILIAGQLVMGAVIDRFGLFGVDRVALGWPRVLGVVLLAVGAGLTLKR